MAVQFDTGATAKFRDAKPGSANAIANLDGDKAIKTNGKAFGFEGVGEPLAENGKPAVRKVTAKDIDAIGQYCADIIVAF